MASSLSARLRLLALVSLLAFSLLLWRQRSRPSLAASPGPSKRDWSCTPAPPGSPPPKKRVAVIGAGSAGASAAYYLRQFGGGCYDLDIDVFERNDYVGGRSTTVSPWGDANYTAELGASIFVEVNHNLVGAARRFGLAERQYGARTVLAANYSDNNDSEYRADGDRFGVWDGSRFVFVQPSGESYWRTVARMLWRYGLAPLRTQRLMRATVGKFLQMYDAPYFPFASLSEASLAVGLADVTAQTGARLLAHNGIAPPFATDLVQASTRVNYAQNLGQIHGLETMVCMATDGAMSVDGGNWRIFEAMLTHADARVHLRTAATSVARENGGYKVSFEDVDDSALGSSGVYDDVILAAPYQFSGLRLPDSLDYVPDAIEYVQLHVTIFTSPLRLEPLFFGLNPAHAVPETVLTTLPDDAESTGQTAAANSTVLPQLDFYSISTLDRLVSPRSGRPEFLYKIFSPRPVTPALLRRLFIVGEKKRDGVGEMQQEKNGADDNDTGKGDDGEEDRGGDDDGITTWMVRKMWHSYPYLPPRVTYNEPVLAPGLWYTAGIESFISTMETSSLMGMNVARLAVARWDGEHERNDEHKKDDEHEKNDEHKKDDEHEEDGEHAEPAEEPSPGGAEQELK